MRTARAPFHGICLLCTTRPRRSGAQLALMSRRGPLLEKIKALGVDFKQRQVDDQGLYQLFMFDPNGVKIELNYAKAEAEGLHAEVKASELPG